MSVNSPRPAAAPLDHFVSTEPFAPEEVEALTPEQERYYMASQWRMMWWRFKRHRLAVVSGIILALMYASILVSEVLAPYGLQSRHTDHIYAPPQTLHLFDRGKFIGPFVYRQNYRLNMENLRREYTPDPAKVQPIRFQSRRKTDLQNRFDPHLRHRCHHMFYQLSLPQIL